MIFEIIIFLAVCILATAILSKLARMEMEIQMTEKEITDGLNKLTAQQGKIAKEQGDRFDAVNVELQKLKDQLANGDLPAATTAFNNLQSAVQSLDDVIPDQPPV